MSGLDLNKPHMFVVVGIHHDPRMLEYLKSVLGHGGCNTFPERSMECTECHSTIVTNREEIACPRCGMNCRAVVKTETFSGWCSRHPGTDKMGCKFLNDAAKR